MRNGIRAIAALILSLGPVGAARADGLGPHGLQFMAGIGLSLLLGGLALSVAFVLAGFFLIRGRRRWPLHVWRNIGFLVLFGVLIMVGGSILTAVCFGG